LFLKKFITLRVNASASIHLAVKTGFDLCIIREMGEQFSSHGKTKKSFIALEIYKLLSGNTFYQ